MRYQERGLVQNKVHKHISHVTKSSTKSSKARMTLQSKFIFILKKFYLMLGPHQSPFIFAWINSINSIIRNHGIRFMLILKRFKIMELGKLFARKKNGNKTLLKVDFWKLIKMGRMKKTGRFEIVPKPKFPKEMCQSGFKKPSSSWEYADVDPGRDDAWQRLQKHSNRPP